MTEVAVNTERPLRRAYLGGLFYIWSYALFTKWVALQLTSTFLSIVVLRCAYLSKYTEEA